MKYIPYATQYINKSDVDAVVKALRSDFLTQGPLVNAFEDEMARYCQAKYAVAVNSGTSALHIACLAAGLKPGDEAITSSLTFVASSNCVLYCGATPVFADIDYKTGCIDPKEIKRKVNSKTRVLIPVDFAGLPARLKEIRAIADKHNLIVIEDACHSLGALYQNSKIGSNKYSDMTILSFHAVKHITTGEGGMVLTNNKDMYKKLKLLRNHGITKDANEFKSYLGHAKDTPCPWYYQMLALGYNYRITDIQCALGLSQLKRLAFFIERRAYIAKLYYEAFCGNNKLILPQEEKHTKSSWHLYIIRLKEDYEHLRKWIFYKFRDAGLRVQVHYIPVYWQPYYQGLGYTTGICPNAEKYYQQAISLPLYPKMTQHDVDRVIKTVTKIIDYKN